MVVKHRDPITEALAAPAMIVHICCQNCMPPKDIDINVFWRGDSKRKFCNVGCKSCKSVTKCRDWLRRYNSEVSTIKDWLRQVSCDGDSHQQVWKLYTGHVASHE